MVVGPAASYGRWITVHAQSLGGSAPNADADVAVVIEVARREQILPSFCDWYGITTREREVLAQLCEGTAVKQIARRLDLSAYTVNDHLKSIFRKTKAAGRDELLPVLN